MSAILKLGFATYDDACNNDEIEVIYRISNGFVTSDALFELFVQFALSLGYQPHSVALTLRDVAEEYASWIKPELID